MILVMLFLAPSRRQIVARRFYYVLCRRPIARIYAFRILWDIDITPDKRRNGLPFSNILRLIGIQSSIEAHRAINRAV